MTPHGTPHLLIVATLLAAGCVADARPVEVDRGLTFAAHEVRAGLVIDRTPHGRTGLATPAGGLLHPALVLRIGGEPDEDMRVMGPGRVVVERRAAGAAGAEIGRVEPSWEHEAIRLTIQPAGGAPIESGFFRRVDHGAGASVLTRLDQDRLDLAGSYRARLRTPDGHEIGWLGLVVGENQPGHVMYEGILPRDLDDGVVAAAAEALGTEIAFIEATSRGVSRKSEER